MVSKAPESSFTDGSVHATVVPGFRNGTNMVMSAGQEVTDGAEVSPIWEKQME